MQKNKYPRFINKKSVVKINSVEENRVFKISIPLFADGDKELMIISKAPKAQDIYGCSRLVYRALKYLHNKKDLFYDVNIVNFVFVFPIIEYTKKTLETILEEQGELFLIGNDGIDNDGEIIKNDEVIFQAMIESDYIIFAWGEPQENIRILYDSRIEYLLKAFKIIKNKSNKPKKAYCIGNFTQNGYPRHCLVWNEELDLIDYDI